jgi:hypothetical protein
MFAETDRGTTSDPNLLAVTISVTETTEYLHYVIINVP